MKLKTEFYVRTDVVQIARELLGKVLVTSIEGQLCEAIITETEAYAGVTDKASHAYGGRLTTRTRPMYLRGGHAYVYLCYGIHHLFNVVTNIEGVPDAVLIRGVEPISGIPLMMKRRGHQELKPALTQGPGALSVAMGIQTIHSGIPLTNKVIWIDDAGQTIPEQDIVASPRVGVAYAAEDALRPYRFRIKGNMWVSKAK
ncbi:MAG: DNA-3-methyladenine glycosylase [Bacteroidia bacterium]